MAFNPRAEAIDSNLSAGRPPGRFLPRSQSELSVCSIEIVREYRLRNTLRLANGLDLVGRQRCCRGKIPASSNSRKVCLLMALAP